MTGHSEYVRQWIVVAMVTGLSATASAQSTLGNITGRATDSSGGALPGATVSVTSDHLIGGARMAITDEGGLYRFTLLPGGIYTVKFELTGLTTLIVEGVDLNAGATMTINGRLVVAPVEETVIVISQVPTIDLEAANVAVNWDQQKLEEIPYSRSLTGLIALIPGLYATAYDVGGSLFGTEAAPAARTFGRAGGNIVSYDGMIWDQTYGDFGTYEAAQVTTAAKGADAMNPGVTMNLIVKSGSNTFRGALSGNIQDGRFQSKNIDQDLLDRGYAPGDNKFTQYKDFYGDVGGRIIRDKLWFYASHRDAKSGQFIPGFISLASGEQTEFFTKLQEVTGKGTYQMTQNNKVEGMFQIGRKWQPYRTASRFVPLEATQNQDFLSLIGPSLKWLSVLGQRATFDASLQRGGYWWPDTPWTADVRMVDRTTNAFRGAFLEQERVPRRWQYAGTFSYFADLGGRNHELKAGYLGWRSTSEIEYMGYPNQQLYRYRSIAGDANLFTRPDSVQIFDYPNTTKSGELYHSLFLNDKITVTRKLTLNVGLRFDRYSSFLPEQGNPGSGPWSTAVMYPERGAGEFPIYTTLVPRLSVVYDVTGEGRVAVKSSYGRYVGGHSGINANPGPGASDVNPNAITTRTYSNWDGSIPYVPVDADLSAVTGGSTNRTFAEGLTGPGVDEYTAGIDVGISRTVTASFNYVKKRDFGNTVTLQLGRPFDAFTDVRFGLDPGKDNIVGTADDGQLPVWSVPRSYPTFGQVIERTVMDDGPAQRSRYDAYGFVINKQNSNGWSALMSYNLDYRDVRLDTPINPNQAAYNRELPEWGHSLRVSGTYRMPFGLLYGMSFTMQSGEWYDREVQVRNALNETLNPTAEENAGRYRTVRIWDNRVTKTLRLRRNNSIEASIDLFNTLNTNVVIEHNIRNGADYLAPLEIIAPRVFRVGLTYRF